MHYLDRVFPMQYSYYSASTWNRGWLLWLLNRNGPLYRASISLASLHQCASSPSNVSHVHELELHAKALRELYEYIQLPKPANLCMEMEDVVEILSCAVTLISFEVLSFPSRFIGILISSRFSGEVPMIGYHICKPHALCSSLCHQGRSCWT